MESNLRAGIRAFLIFLWVVIVVPPVLLSWWLKRYDWQDKFLQWFYRGTAFIAGLNIRVEGPRSDARPLMIVSNHCSYLDVFVLGCLFPVRFTPKSEVRSWPVFGALVTISGAIYIERKASKAGEQKEALQEIFRNPICVSIFPEGTTNDGRRLHRFKSSLFSLAEGKLPSNQYLPVQPVAIAYTRINNLPLGERWRSFYAWYGDMEFVPHAWNVLKQGSVTVHVTCLPTVTSENFPDRKALANYCHDAIAERLEKMLRQYA